MVDKCRPLRMSKDINGHVTYGIPFATAATGGQAWESLVGADTEQTLVVPDNCDTAIFSYATINQSIPFMRVSSNTILVAPTNAFSQTDVDINPTIRQVKGGDTLHFYALGNDTLVSVSFWRTLTPSRGNLAQPENVLQETLYVSNFGGAEISVIDPTTNLVTSTVATGGNPTATFILPDESRLYIGNGLSPLITVVDLYSNLKLYDIPISAAGSNNFSFSNGYLYAGVPIANEIAVINTINDQVIQELSISGGATKILLSPLGDKLYALNVFGNQLEFLSTLPLKLLQTFNFSAPIDDMVLSNDGKKLYLTQAAEGILVIDTASGAIVRTFSLGGERGICLAITPDNTRLFCATTDPQLHTIDLTTNTVIGAQLIVSEIPTREGLIMDKEGVRMYIVSGDSPGGVQAFDIPNDTILTGLILTGNGASGGAFNRDESRLYVTNKDNQNVAVVDTALNTVISTILVSLEPDFPSFLAPTTLKQN